MPTYVYVCECEKEKEIDMSFAEFEVAKEKPIKCDCGKDMRRLIFPASIQFGPGFYNTGGY